MISKFAMSRSVVAAARATALVNKAPLAATTLHRSITSFAPHSSSSTASIAAISALPRNWKSLPPCTTYTTTRAMSSNNEKNASFVSSSLFSCKDRTALVTGGGTGIGLMAVQALVANGAKVYITGRTKEKLDKVVELYSQGEGSIVPLVADVSKKDDIAKLVKEIESKEQSLDILINNAGIAGATQQTESESAAEMKKNLFDDESATFEDWTNTYRTNVPQIYFMTTAFLPLLQKSSERHHGWSGTVINISSISGMVMSAQHHFSYNASKAAAIHLNRMLASEIATNKLKIRVNSIAPGVFPSEMTADDSGNDQKSHIPKDKYADKVPAARPGKDEDMAQAVLFCATNQYLNGQTFAVDGGYTLAAGQ